MSSTPTYVDGVVKFHASALHAHDEAQALIQSAREWIVDFSGYPDDVRGDTARLEAEVNKRVKTVDEMERSYARAVFSIVMRPTAFDGGEVQLSRDGDACMFFRYPKSGYVGGIIFHRSGEGPCGTWGVHT